MAAAKFTNLNVSAAARVVMDAWDNYQDALAETDPDKAWAERAALRHLEAVLAPWGALVGLEGMTAPVAAARAAATVPTTAHTAPF